MKVDKWMIKKGYGNDVKSGNGKDKRAANGRIRTRIKNTLKKLEG